MTDLKNLQYAILYRNARGCAWLIYDIFGVLETAEKAKEHFIESEAVMDMDDPEVRIVEWTLAD